MQTIINKILYATKHKSSAIVLEQDVRRDVGLVLTVETGLARTACRVSRRGHLRLAPLIYSTIVGSKIIFFQEPCPD
jgi:hypothetical protein